MIQKRELQKNWRGKRHMDGRDVGLFPNVSNQEFLEEGWLMAEN
jgi:hypothetical protein